MAKAELGTKRTCPETEKKFYDLNKDPVISPYTGKSYPLSFFDLPTGPSRAKPAPPIKAVQPEAAEDDEEDDLELEGAEVVSLEDADDDDTASDDGKNMPDLGDNTDDDIADVDLADDDDDDSDDDTFLAVDDEDDDDVSDIVPISGDDEDDS